MKEQDLKDFDSIAIVVDRSGIAAALDFVAVIPESPEEPNGWRAALRIFEQQPRAEYLLAVNGRVESATQCHMYLCLNSDELASAIAAGTYEHLRGSVATMWSIHGDELTHARVAKLLDKPLKNWS